jgi:hypothetical protein
MGSTSTVDDFFYLSDLCGVAATSLDFGQYFPIEVR